MFRLSVIACSLRCTSFIEEDAPEPDFFPPRRTQSAPLSPRLARHRDPPEKRAANHERTQKVSEVRRGLRTVDVVCNAVGWLRHCRSHFVQSERERARPLTLA